MAVTLDITNLTQLWDGDSVQAYSGLSDTLYTSFFRESTGCLGDIANNTTISGYLTVTSFNINNEPVRIWMYITGVLDTVANGGVTMSIGDGTNRRSYYVGGTDQLNFQVGSWACFLLDGNNLPASYDVEAGTVEPTLTAITQVGMGCTTLSKALGGADNFFWDICRHGEYIVIGGGGVGTEGTMAEAVADDESTATGKAHGFLRTLSENVYGCQGSIYVGDEGTGNSYFKDTDATLIFEDTGLAALDFKLSGNATGTNSFELGTKIGTGDTAVGANGYTLIGNSNTAVSVDLTGANFATNKTYGGKIQLCTGTITLGTSTSSEFIGWTIDQCGQTTANQGIIRNGVFSGYSGTSAAMLWNSTINIKNYNFNNNANGTSNASAIEHASPLASTYDGLLFTGNDFDVLNSGNASTITAGSFVVGEGYKILTVGTTDFTLIGSADNNIGTKFVATGIGSGTGTATEVLVINKVNGANPSTARNTGTNADTSFVAAFVLTLTDIPNPTNVTIVNSSTRTELQHGTVTSGSTTYTHGGGETVDILFNALAYDPNLSDIYDLLLPNADSSIKVQAVDDPNYVNP